MNITEIERAVKIVGGQSALARACGVTQPAVFRWLSGKSRPNPRFAIFIEKATNGEVSRIDLCPDLFTPETAQPHGEPPCPAPCPNCQA